jgi:hypothetical protein
MTLPAENLIAHTLEKMNARIADSVREGRIRSGLLFTGNVHDAYPRRLILDTRLSPLDKTAWMIIRLYAQQNEGAVFPTYDELQLQLASPGKGKASRETVSRVLLMLRLTGWLSLCKRVRDDKGRVRGNIYAQHDEPLTACDADELDPLWLDVVTVACEHRNNTIKMTARHLVSEIRNDPTLRHYHSHLAQIEARLGAPQTPQQMAKQAYTILSSVSEPGQKQTELSGNKLSSETELSPGNGISPLSSDPEPPVKSGVSDSVRKPNHKYVRNITQSVKRNTYVLPAWFEALVSQDDMATLARQLQSLPEESAGYILSCLDKHNPPRNPVGWLLAMLKKAREGTLNIQDIPTASTPPTKNREAPRSDMSHDEPPPQQRYAAASAECVISHVADIRAKLNQARKSTTGGRYRR